MSDIRINGRGIAVRDGITLLPVRISVRIKTGECFASFHNPAVMLNRLTSLHRDRYVKSPEFKCTAVCITLLSYETVPLLNISNGCNTRT